MENMIDSNGRSTGRSGTPTRLGLQVSRWTFLAIIVCSCAGSGGRYPERLSTKHDIRAAKPDIEDIDIWNLPLQDYPLLSKFKRLKKVKLFSLEGILATDEKLRALAGLGFTNLTYIDLNNCRLVTDEGVRDLAKIGSLKHLQLEGTAITDGACGVMASQMRLAVINVANCSGVTQKGLAALGSSDALRGIRFSADKLTQNEVLELITSFKSISECEIVDTLRKLDANPLKAMGAERGIHVTVMAKGALQWSEERKRKSE